MSRGEIWQDKEIRLLISLAASKKSVDEIARALNRSRIEILGKLARLGLRVPGSLKTTDKSPQAPTPFGGTPRAKKHKPAPIPSAKKPSVGCRFPMWGFGEYPTNVYCNKRRISLDRSYCEEHHELCTRNSAPSPG